MAGASVRSSPPLLRGIVTVAIATFVLSSGPVVHGDVEAAGSTAARDHGFTAPHVLDGHIVDVIARVRGGATCSGTVISDGTMVATAAHCVLDIAGDLARSRTVVRDGVTYRATSVLVDRDHAGSPRPWHDVAVLVMARPIPGPSAVVGTAMPATGDVTLVGMQPLDTDGSLLRRDDDRPRPSGATGPVVHIRSAPAGCIGPVAGIDVTATRLTAPCGLVQGASGGGLLIERAGSVQLLGIISTVADDLTFNGLAPTAGVERLLADSAASAHALDATRTSTATPNLIRW